MNASLTTEEVTKLATYNSEVARGIVHHSEWHAQMKELQRRFNIENYGSENPEPGSVRVVEPDSRQDLRIRVSEAVRSMNWR